MKGNTGIQYRCKTTPKLTIEPIKCCQHIKAGGRNNRKPVEKLAQLLSAIFNKGINKYF